MGRNLTAKMLKSSSDNGYFSVYYRGKWVFDISADNGVQYISPRWKLLRQKIEGGIISGSMVERIRWPLSMFIAPRYIVFSAMNTYGVCRVKLSITNPREEVEVTC